MKHTAFLNLTKVLLNGILLNGALLFLVTCQQKSTEKYMVYSEFPKMIPCTSSEISLDTLLFRYPYRIKVSGTKAIIMDLHHPDHYYHLFSYPDFKPMDSFGRRGNGSNEILSGENVIFLNPDTIFTLDGNKREIKHWKVNAEKNVLYEHQTIPLEEAILRPLDFALYNDSTFIIPDYSGLYRFCLLNKKGKIIGRHGKIPVEESLRDHFSAPALAQGWRSFIDYNPKNKVLAMATQLGEVLEVYHLGDSISNSVIIGPNGTPDFEVNKGYAIPVGIMGFSDIHVSDSLIYAVFHGQSFREMESMGYEALDGGRYIYMYDLNGKPVCQLELDRNIYSICIDAQRGKIMALDVNSDHPLVEYDLPKIVL
ncbi:MAG: TolB-like 6-bladed beta-propeller domain-containing protein [Odoribacter sp.]|nr:TolB-like 6-bladed beta-propeller domain-containing protein [Odoribacter sp.]